MIACAALAVPLALDGHQDARGRLEPGISRSGVLAAGEMHSYDLPIAAGRFVRVRLTRDEGDAALIVADSSGKTIADTDSNAFPPGSASASVVAREAITYRVDVRSLEKGATPLRYALAIEESRTAAPGDEDRVEADRAYTLAEQQRLRATANTLRAAAPEYERARSIYQALNDAAGEGVATTGLGRVQDALGEKSKALDTLRRALELHKRLADRRAQAYTLNFIAVILDQTGDKRAALAALDEALPLARAIGDRRVEGITLNNFGIVHFALGDRQTALQFYRDALSHNRAARNLRAEATTLSNIGGLYDAMGDRDKALEHYMLAVPLRRQIGDPREEAQTLNNIGVAYARTDEWPRALEYYRQAIDGLRRAGDRAGEGATLHNIASVLEAQGEHQQALQLYSEALPHHRAVGARPAEANTLNNIGRVYAALGDVSKARSLYEQALAIHRAVGNRSSEAATLTNLGSVMTRLGNPAAAMTFYRDALALRRAVRDRTGEALTLNNIGRLLAAGGEWDQALDTYTQALALHRAVNSRRGEAFTLLGIGALRASRGDPAAAIDNYRQALPLLKAAADRSAEASALYAWAQAERDRGNLDEARAKSAGAIALVESLRQEVTSSELRAFYLASVRSYYELDIDILMALHQQQPAAGFDAAALGVSEGARARSLLELLAEAHADIREGVEPALLDRERSLAHLLSAKAERQMRLLAGAHSDEAAGRAASEIVALTSDYQEVQARIRAKSPRYAALTQPQPLGASGIQQKVLDPGTVLFEYALGDRRSYLWVVSTTAIVSYTLPPRAEIDAAARAFHAAMTSEAPAAQAAESAKRLSEMILAPAAAHLASPRIVVVADGALQYVPFAALPAPAGSGRPLVQDREIVMLPSASALDVLRRETGGRPPAPKAIAVLADPVFSADDPRVTRARLQKARPGDSPARQADAADATAFARLIGSRREATEILALVRNADRRQALDFEASRATASSGELAQYRVVHFATHGVLDSAHPELSGLVLSLVDERGRAQDGFVRLHDIYNLKLPIELVVLSACQTGLGREIRGEGLIGLTRGFMYAGAPRVVASLWKVDDRATAELMKHFYQGLFGPERMRPAAALRAAQIAVSRQRRWQSPYYWAGFVLQGEWR